MNIGYRITRAAIETAIDKGIKDVKYDTDRAIRNLIDLGEYFSTGEYQREFFDMAHSILKGGESPYSCIFKSTVERVDTNIIKTFGINLGYGSFTYGSELLRGHTDGAGCMLPWSIAVDARGCAEPARLDWLVNEGKKLGIYLYSIVADKLSQDGVISAALNHRECAFIVFAQPSDIDDSLAEGACDAANILIFADLGLNADVPKEDAFSILSKHRCLYGYAVTYDGLNQDFLLSDGFLSDMEDEGCLLGCYIAAPDCDDATLKRVHGAIVDSRLRGPNAMFLVDYMNDSDYIGTRVAGNDLILYVSLRGGTAVSCNQAGIYRRTDTEGCNCLSDIMIQVMPAM